MSVIRLRPHERRGAGVAAPPDNTVWRPDRLYAIAFDLDQAALKRHYPGAYPQNAYDDICRELLAHRFRRQQGSVYFGEPGTNPVACVLAVQELSKRYPWFRHAVKDIRMLRIEENNDLMPAVGQGELSLRSASEA